MRYETIADIYSANQKIRERFVEAVGGISPDEATALPEGEKWDLRHLIEHVSTVGSGISLICAKLLAAAKIDNKPSNGSFSVSAHFGEKSAEIADIKVEAPERVHPTGEVNIDEALLRLTAATAAFDALRPDMESLDFSAHTIPHPFLGELTAGEWFVIAGRHEHRHTAQIERLLAKIRQ